MISGLVKRIYTDLKRYDGNMEFLFEIGWKSSGADDRRGAGGVERRVVAMLERERLVETGVASKSFSTPRRLAVWVADVAARQQDVAEELVGPAVKIAYQGWEAEAGGDGVCEEGGRGCGRAEDGDDGEGRVSCGDFGEGGTRGGGGDCRGAAEGAGGDLLGEEHGVARRAGRSGLCGRCAGWWRCWARWWFRWSSAGRRRGRRRADIACWRGMRRFRLAFPMSTSRRC